MFSLCLPTWHLPGSTLPRRILESLVRYCDSSVIFIRGIGLNEPLVIVGSSVDGVHRLLFQTLLSAIDPLLNHIKSYYTIINLNIPA